MCRTPRDMVRPWGTLNADEKKLFSRLMEVYAGFSEYTDAQVGRIIDYLEKTGQLENTVVIFAADNGASGEGSPNGSVNENKFFNGYPDELEENLKLIDRLGGPDTYEHYPPAGRRRRRRRSRCSSATRSMPAARAIRWSSRGRRASRRAEKCATSTTTAPTSSRRSSTSAGWRCPRSTAASSSIRCPACRCATPSSRQRRRRRRSVSTTRCSGRARSGRTAGRPSRSTRRSRARAISTRTCGSCITSTSIRPSRRIWRRSTRTSCRRSSRPGSKRRRRTWCCRSTTARRSSSSTSSVRRRSRRATRYIYYPGTSPVPEGVAVNVRGRSYKILADVEITDPNCSGVIFAHGSRFGGHSLFIKNKKLYYVYNFLGIPPEQQFVSRSRLEARQVHARHGVHAREGGPVPRVARHDQALRERQGRGRRTDARAGRQVHAVGRRPVRRARQRRRREPASTSRPARSRAARSSASASASRRTQYLDLEKMAAAAYAVD